MIAVQAPHRMPERDIVPANVVAEELERAIVKIGVLRSQLVEVDLHVGIDGLDG